MPASGAEFDAWVSFPLPSAGISLAPQVFAAPYGLATCQTPIRVSPVVSPGCLSLA